MPILYLISISSRFCLLKLFCCVISIATAYEANADGGVAFLAMRGFNRDTCERALSVFRDSPTINIAVLWPSFGSRNMCLRKFIRYRRARPHSIEYYLSNEVCRRKHNCTKLDLSPRSSVKSYNKKLASNNSTTYAIIQETLDSINALQYRYPRVDCRVAVGLEDNYSIAAAREIVRYVKDNTSCAVVRNPVSTRPARRVGASFIEYHGLLIPSARDSREARRSIVSLDGCDISDKRRKSSLSCQATHEQVSNWIGRNRVRNRVFLWTAASQGLSRDSSRDIRSYDRKYIISHQDVGVLRKFLREIF
jgi:hypothetical protein